MRLFIIILALFLQSCGQSGVEFYKVQFREGLAYLPNETVPFTGSAFSNYDNGQKELIFNYKDGLQFGQQKEWFKNGQLKTNSNMDNKDNYSIKNWNVEGQVSRIINIKNALNFGYNYWKTDSSEFYFNAKNGVIDGESFLEVNKNSHYLSIHNFYENGFLVKSKKVEKSPSFTHKLDFESEFKDKSQFRFSRYNKYLSTKFGSCNTEFIALLSKDKTTITNNEIKEGCDSDSNSSDTPNTWKPSVLSTIETSIENGKISLIYGNVTHLISIQTGLVDSTLIELTDDKLSILSLSEGLNHGYIQIFDRNIAEWHEIDSCIIWGDYISDISVCDDTFNSPKDPNVYLNNSQRIMVLDTIKMAEEKRLIEKQRLLEEKRLAEEKGLAEARLAIRKNANCPKPIIRMEPKYPIQPARDGKEGEVILSYDINEVGGVSNVEVLKATPERIFDREAIRALRKWKYKPKIVQGKPQNQLNRIIQLDFRLHTQKSTEKKLFLDSVYENFDPNDTFKGKQCVVDIQLGVGGVLLRVEKLFGDDAFCRSTKKAIFEAGDFPVSRTPKVAAELTNINITIDDCAINSR